MDKQKQSSLEAFDRFEEADFRSSVGVGEVDRRDFFKLVGGGILVSIVLPLSSLAQRRGGENQLPTDLNAFLKIGEDGAVTGFTGKIEMGQGVITSLAQTLAEELDVPLDRVTMVMGDTDLCPWDMGTFGSMTTRFFGPPFRAAAAEAKAILKELAAERLGVPASELTTRDGTVRHEASGRSVTYAELTQGRKIARHLDAPAAVENPSSFTLVGKPLLRRDAREKVTGKAVYSGDVVRPGMLYARLLRPPAHGSRLLKVDTSAARNFPGALVVEDGDLVAVLHERPDIAERGLALVKADWEVPKTGLDNSTIHDHILKSAGTAEIAAQGGDLAVGQKAADLSVSATYFDGYVAHAAIEPHTAVAEVSGDHATVWASTQTPFRLKEEAAEALGVPPGNVRVLPPFVGGGFGGKSSNRQAIEAVRLAKAVGKPVQVAWTRGEEFFLDTFRPAAVIRINAGVSSSGEFRFWDYGVYGAGERGSQQFYKIPHHRTAVFGAGWQGASKMHPLATGAWRAPANNTNTFARESHVDVMAARAKMDPVEFRLKNLTDPRIIRVLKTAAEKFGWTPAPAPSGRGFGFALGFDAGTYVAHAAAVEVDRKTGQIRVKRVVCAQDMGLSINPEGSKIQMEGCITMGLGYALAEEIHFKNGVISESNFDTYHIPRFSWLPDIETVIIDDREAPPQGGGEPAIVCMGAVIANAVFDAIGVRVYQQPLTPERVLAAK